MASIQGSVGRNGQNRPEDVRVVQELLAGAPEDVLPAAVIRFTGVCDLATIGNIEEFQTRALRMTSPTGRIEPKSPTWLALARLARPASMRQAA